MNDTALRDAGVPERVVRTVVAGVEETDAIRAVRAWLPTPDGFLVLAGPPGTGKSTAAGLALAEVPPERVVYESSFFPADATVIDKPRTIRFADAHELAQASNFDSDLWAPLRRAHLLVIDDTGRELLDNTGRALGNLVNLLCRRHDDAKRTVCTTNLDAQSWVKRYCSRDGGRLLDRMREQERQHGRSAFCAVSGASLRGRRGVAA